MHYDIQERPIADQDARSNKGQAGVLHPSERERGGHHENVVLFPNVRAKQLFAKSDVPFHCPREF